MAFKFFVKIFSLLPRTFRFILRVFSSLIGTFSWSPPRWFAAIFESTLVRKARGLISSWTSYLRQHKRVLRWGGLIILFLLVVYIAYLAMPKPVEFDISGTAPEATKLEPNAKPSPIQIDFSGSAARLDLVGKVVTKGISITPPISGEWKWESDTTLTFTPREDWGVDQEYKVKLDKAALFPDHVRIQRYEYRFKSAPFKASISNSSFYQDPVNPKIKQVVATVVFSHPVDTADFEKHLTLTMGKSKGILGFGSESFPFTVSYNKFNGEAYIHSNAIEVPQKDTYMTLTISNGIRSLRGGKGTGEKMERRVDIPGIYNFFRIQSAGVKIARNDHNEPEHVLVVEASAGAQESVIEENINAYLLPQDLPAIQDRPAQKNYHWNNVSEIGPEILKISTPVKLDPLPAESEYPVLHSFKCGVPGKRYVYIKINKGIESYGGYRMAKDYDVISMVPEFPKELNIMYDGAILSMSGEKKVTVLSRDIDTVRFELSRIIPSEINHLITQTGGEFKKPYFHNSYNFNEDNISERFVEIRDLARLEPGKTQYSAFELSHYLSGDSDGKGRRGLFFLKVNSWDKVNKRATDAGDRRLILITDLGILVKDNADGSHDLFVQSIHDGRPVSGAQVQVLGKNGLSVISASTNAEGHANFPKLKDFEREKEPAVYLVRSGDDLSYLPYNRSDRHLNLSRFEIDGEVTGANTEKLNAYLFSDRGIYRPGDEFKVGLIVKALDWKQKLAGIPLETVVTDSRGLEVQKQKISLSPAGFEELKYKTEDTSPTGNYDVNVYIVKDGQRGNLLGSTTVRVEEFLPDRLKISSRFSRERAEGWVSPQDLKATVSLKNLFGTPATARRVSAVIKLSPIYPAFRSYKDYVFFDPLYAKNGVSERLQDKKTDDQGNAEFELGLERFDKATYRLSFTAEGYETEGGRGVATESNILVSPLAQIIGYKTDGDMHYIKKGSSRNIRLIALDPSLKMIAAKDISANLLEVRYVSVLVRQNDGTFKYESVRKEIPVEKKEITITQNGLNYTLPTDKPGDFLFILKSRDETELNRIEFSVVGQGNLSRSLEKNAELQIMLSKTDYAPGEEIEMQIKAPYTGAGLITIERDRIYSYKWFKTDSTSSVQKITVPANIEGNGYVNVTFVRAMDSPEIFMSPLSYGVAPFFVSRERVTNAVDLESPEMARPGENYVIRYKSKKPGKIVIFAVDEGVLQVAKYNTPNPLDHFFKKRALEVKTAQILDLIMPEFKQIKLLSAPGGDDEGYGAIGKNLNPFKRKRDKPVAYWSGIMDTGPDFREVSYQVPDFFNGTLRVMAVAVSPDSVGVAQKKGIIRGHFVLTPNVPTFVAPGDEFEVSVGVANNVESSGKDGEVALEVKPSEHLEILGKSAQTFKIGEGRESSASFKFRAKRKLGSANLAFSASMGEKQSRYSIDLSVRPPVPYVTTVNSGYLDSGKTDIPVTRKMYPNYRILETTASPLPLGLSHGLINYLNKFPFGCTEQLVSQAFPAIVLKHRPEFGYDQETVNTNLENVVRMLRARQNSEGAFGFWAANSHVSDFQTVYAMHFLTEARERNYPVPPDMFNRGLEYLKALADKEGETLSDGRVRAYAIYILTRNGIVTTNYLNALRSQLDSKHAKAWKKDLTGIYLAAVYKLLKQDSQAYGLIRGSEIGQTQTADYAYFYDDLVRDAQLLYILSRHFPERLKNVDGKALSALVRPVTEGQFNTLSSSYCILAFDAYADSVSASANFEAAVSEIQAEGKGFPLSLPKGTFPRVDFSEKAEKIRISNKGDIPLFYQLTQAGFDLSLPSGEIKKKLEVQREYRDAGGKVIEKAALGSEIEVHIKIRSIESGGLQNVAIVDLLPGGFEVVMDSAPRKGTVTQRMEDEGEGEPFEENEGFVSPIISAGTNWRPDYVDIREDRVVLFGTVSQSASEFVYRVKATNKGIYAVPPVFGESMYDRTVQGRGVGGKLAIEGN